MPRLASKKSVEMISQVRRMFGRGKKWREDGVVGAPGGNLLY